MSNYEVRRRLLLLERALLSVRKAVDDQEAIIGRVAAGKLLCSDAARMLNMAPVEFVQLLNSHGITLLKPTADELQRELEFARERGGCQ